MEQFEHSKERNKNEMAGKIKFKKSQILNLHIAPE